jgi:hypothetical protein
MVDTQDKATEIAIAAAVSQLLPVVRGANTCAWIGSGFSTAVGFPNWSTLVADLCGACGVNAPNTESAEDLIQAAQDCRDAAAEAYWSLLAKRFSGADTRAINFPESLLRLLRLELKAYLTTNFDHLLRNAAADRGWNQYQKYPDLRATDLGDPKIRAVYLHGIGPEQPDVPASDLILTTSDFAEAYPSGQETESRLFPFLRAVFSENNLLFFACSMSDRWTRKTLERLQTVRARLYTRKKKPVWIMVREMNPPEMAALLNAVQDHDAPVPVEVDQSGGITSIGYPNFSGTHAELESILKRLSASMLQTRIQSSTEAPGPFLEER